MIARGIMLGADQPVILHMLDIPPATEALNGVKMELIDAAFPLLKGKRVLNPHFYLGLVAIKFEQECNGMLTLFIGTVHPAWSWIIRVISP
jgi:hypothetical protein